MSAPASRPRGDVVLGIVMLVVAAVYYVIAAGIPRGGLADGVGPGGLPKAYALALAVLSIALIVRACAPEHPWNALTRRWVLASRRSTPVTGARRRDRPADRAPYSGRTAAMLAVGAAYAAVAGWVGYIPALAGLMFAAIFCQGGAAIPIRRALAIAVAGAVVFWVLFVLVLRVPQPTASVSW